MTRSVVELSLFFSVTLASVVWMRVFLVRWRRFREQFERGTQERLERVHLFVSPNRLLWAYCVFSVGLSSLTALTVGAPGYGIACMLALAWLPAWLLGWIERRRVRRIAAQLPDAFGRMASLLQAGISLSLALEHMAGRMPAPLGHELQHVQRERRLGIGLTQAIHGLSQRVPLRSLSLFSCLIQLSHNQGGGLAQAMTSLADVSRRQLFIEAKCQALSAQARLQARVMSFIPILVAAVVYAFDPLLLSETFSRPWGKALLLVALALGSIGLLWVSRIGRSE